MPYHYTTCPNCQEPIRIPTYFKGQTVTCPKCKDKVANPGQGVRESFSEREPAMGSPVPAEDSDSTSNIPVVEFAGEDEAVTGPNKGSQNPGRGQNPFRSKPSLKKAILGALAYSWLSFSFIVLLGQLGRGKSAFANYYKFSMTSEIPLQAAIVILPLILVLMGACCRDQKQDTVSRIGRIVLSIFAVFHVPIVVLAVVVFLMASCSALLGPSS